jgi:peptidoglycan hydrolase FlgJ
MGAITGIGTDQRGARAGDATARPTGADPAGRALPYNMVSQTSKSGELKPAQQFEAFVLQSFVEPMLPKDDSSYFGEGTAGSIWKSMLAERIGAEMAVAGGIGIAAMVEKRNASAEALAEGTDAAAKSDAMAKGAALSKPGSL